MLQYKSVSDCDIKKIRNVYNIIPVALGIYDSEQNLLVAVEGTAYPDLTRSRDWDRWANPDDGPDSTTAETAFRKCFATSPLLEDPPPSTISSKALTNESKGHLSSTLAAYGMHHIRHISAAFTFSPRS